LSESVSFSVRTLTSKDLFMVARNIYEALTRDLKTIVDSNIHKDYFERVMYSLQDVFWEILYYNTVAPEERAAEIKKAFDQAYSILAELEYVKGTQSKESFNKDNQDQGEQMKTIEELRREFPDLVAVIEKEALGRADFEKVTKEMEALKGEVAELKTNLDASLNAKAAAEQVKALLEKELGDIKAKEAKEARNVLIEALIKKHSVPVEVVTERFRNKLHELPDDLAVEEEVKDRISGLNLTTVTHSLEKDQQDQKLTFDSAVLADALMV